jgi:uncharacterized protein (DUF433 family)
MAQDLEKQHIVATPGTCGGKPRIDGTRIRVQDVYIWHEVQGRSADEIVASYPHLSLAEVYAALAYYCEHRAEIKRQIAEGHEFVAALKAELGPGPLERKLKGLDGPSASISS